LIHPTLHLRNRLLLLLLTGLIWAWSGSAALAGGVDAENRPIARIAISGLHLVPEQMVKNHIRSQAGEPYRDKIVQQDIKRLTHLGLFEQIIAVAEPLDDGSVVLHFKLVEAPILADVQIAGSKQIDDQELLDRVKLQAGDPADRFLIESGVQQIVEAYEEQGYFVADVSVDEDLLSESQILIYRVREGPKLRIRAFNLEGNSRFADKLLRSKIKSKTYLPLFRKGELNRRQLELDAATIREYYQDRGYLDAQVGRRIDISPNETDAVVTFVISEGSQYHVAVIRIEMEGEQLFTDQQIESRMALGPGAVFSTDKVRKSVESILDMYGKLGFLEVQVNIAHLFHENQPQADLLVRINEGIAYTVGRVTVRGNELTKGKVIQRQVRGMRPGRPFDRTGVEETRRRLNESSLFSQGTVTILGEPSQRVRDVLIEVKEGSTGSFGFGAGISSDAGVIGAVDLVQRNFDITDFPDSVGEFFTGQAFRGAGQYFALSLQPGNETSRYSATFREPYLMASDYFLDTTAFYFTREREDWDEQRAGGAWGLGQRFGDVWSGSVKFRAEEVEISDIDPSAPVDIFAVRGSNRLTSASITIGRDSTDSRLFPSRGTKFEIILERVGLLGGDFDFTRSRVKYIAFWTVNEDFLSRKTVVSFRSEVGLIFGQNESPVFERFYAGGHRSFRGFGFRGVGPRGVRNNTGLVGDDPVGGDFLAITSLQYEFPMLGRLLRGVVFTDQGTVQDEIGLDSWRITVGTGIRLRIPFLSQAPFAFDIAVPLLSQDGDEEQLFSFDIALPFQ
jgi:outer membrane protein insertion porin family